jgi:hypothetical protein
LVDSTKIVLVFLTLISRMIYDNGVRELVRQATHN